MADRVRLGIIGTSGWAEMLYFNTLRGYDDVELVPMMPRRTRSAISLSLVSQPSPRQTLSPLRTMMEMCRIHRSGLR